ncbi:MAG: sensor histidine kinase, partial [Nitrospinota bacterium]
LHPEDHERVLAERAESYAKGEPFITEYRVLSREGRVLWFSNHAEFVRDETGKPLFLQGIMIDQTNRKEAEEQIRRYNEELEKQVKQRTEEVRELERQRAETEKLAATGRLAAGIAHEINNPLAGIKNAFQLIQDAVPETHPHHHYVGRIEKEINRIANIVRQMYNLYKPEPGTLREVDLNLVVRDIVALLEPKGRQRDVLLTVETPALPIRAFLPEGSLAQVLYNLLMNAIEASPAGDEVKVSTALAGAGRARIRVSDRGPGIPEDLRSRVFEPFFTTKSDPSEAGLGLGLSISRSLVEAMGGALDFESEPGRGTVFRTDLPLRARTIEPERPETEKEASPL